MPARRTAAVVAWLAAALLAGAPAAFAIDLDGAKSKGLLGERADGFVGIVVASPSPEIQALAETVNAKRRSKYEEIARKNGTSVDAVAALAGQKLIDRAPKGEWVADPSGKWRMK